MIFRTSDWHAVATATAPYPEMTKGQFDPEEWTANPDNIALTNDDGDVALFEYGAPSTYVGHYVFKSRGNQAFDVATDMLAFMFKYFDTEVIIGMTPVDHKGALWLTKRLGFTSYGELDTLNGKEMLSILTRKEYEGKA